MATLLAHDFTRVGEAASAYDALGKTYLRYADGDVAGLFDFSSRYSFADREIWARIEDDLVAIRTSGRRSIRIVDAGCGPGTWLRRCVLRAHALGFEDIEAHGFDISTSMIALAREAGASIAGPSVSLTFDVADISDGLSRQDGPADLALCLYGVMNHLPVERHAEVAQALARAARSLFVTVRTVGSMPSIFVAGLEEARAFRQDNAANRLEIELSDGRHLGFPSHLFSATEFTSLFEHYGHVRERVGLDLFHGRFALDPRWNPPGLENACFEAALVRLEHLCASDPCFLDRAAHVLLHLNGREAW